MVGFLLPLLAHAQQPPLVTGTIRSVSDGAARGTLAQLATDTAPQAARCHPIGAFPATQVDLTVSGGRVVQARSDSGDACIEDLVSRWDAAALPDTTAQVEFHAAQTVLMLLGTHGSGDATEDMLSSDALGALDDVLQGVPGIAVASSPKPEEVRLPRSSVETGDTTLDGQPAPDGVRLTVRRYLRQLQYCHELHLKEDAALAGQMELSTVLVAGLVVSGSAREDTIGHTELEQCVVRKVKRWRFPEELSGTLVLPLSFTVE